MEEYNNILGRLVRIEDANGDSIMVFAVDEKGNIVDYHNCSIADVDIDDVFETGKEVVRVQALYGEVEIDYDKVQKDLDEANQKLKSLDKTMECCAYGKRELQEREALTEQVNELENIMEGK